MPAALLSPTCRDWSADGLPVLRYVALLLLILLLALEVKLWTGEWSMREVWHLRQRVAEQKQENLKLKQRTEALSAEVQDPFGTRFDQARRDVLPGCRTGAGGPKERRR